MTTKISFREDLDKRIFSVFVLGILSGLPWVMLGSALTLWLIDLGTSRAAIGYAGLIFSFYSLNFLWSPLIDRYRLAYLGSFLSQRQSWILPCSTLIALCCCIVFFSGPGNSGQVLVGLGLGIAFLSATQDIAIDAYRVDSFARGEQKKISFAASAATAGWWTGYAAIGFLPLYLSDKGWRWEQLYLLLGAIHLSIAIAAMFLPKPKHQSKTPPNFAQEKYLYLVNSLGLFEKCKVSLLALAPFTIGAWAFFGSPGISTKISQHATYIPCLILFVLSSWLLLALKLVKLVSQSNKKEYSKALRTSSYDHLLSSIISSLAEPVADFFKRNGIRFASTLLLFIFLFKIGEAFLGRMSLTFYKEIGFSNTEIAAYSKMLTWWVTIASAMVAGVLNAKLGTYKGLLISGIVMAAANLMFALIAQVGPSIPLYIATVVVDGFAGAWSTVAFVAFISALCNHTFSATQYALLASLGALGRTALSSMSGELADWLDNWTVFFVFTTLMVLPSMFILIKIRKKI